MPLPKEVTIREVGPREGVQTSDHVISTDQKLALIDILAETGVKDIEISSLVRSDKVPQMVDAEEVINRYNKRDGVRYTALYLNVKGFERGEALGARLTNPAWLNIAASETFLKKNNNTTLEEAVKKVPSWLQAFTNHGKSLQGLMLSTAFACAYEGKIPTEKVMTVLQQVIAITSTNGHSLKEVCLADTIGHANPEGVRALIQSVKKSFPNLVISLHLHDTFGFGLANVYAGLLEGVSIFDGSVGGIGGCPFMKGAAGNVATEGIVHLCHEMGISTGISLEKYRKAAQFARALFIRQAAEP